MMKKFQKSLNTEASPAESLIIWLLLIAALTGYFLFAWRGIP